MEVLRIENISKRYGSIQALKDLSLTVESGQVLGILGPNGSGKTTTLGIILGILKANSGHYTWFNNKYEGNHKLHIGSILETPNFFPYLNADDNLDIVRQIKKVPSQDYGGLLEMVKLKARRKSTFRTYSLGMKQRLAIAATLIGDPEVVIFDEPTNGLDPEGIAEVRATLQEIAARGKTVIMASHILAEVEKICSHVAILKQGRLLATGPVGAILSSDLYIEIDASDRNALLSFLANHASIKTVSDKGSFLECIAEENLDVSELTTSIVSAGIRLTHLVARKRKLEEEFLHITQNSQ